MDQEKLLQQGIAAARVGQKAQARRLLRQALDLNPRSELAWLWLGGLAERDAERVACLQRALAINPHNAKAHQALEQLQAQSAAAPPRCPHCGAAVRAGARFCASCGQPLTAAAPPAPPRPKPSSTKETRRSLGGRKGVAIAALGLVLVILCGVGGWFVAQKLWTEETDPTAVAVMTLAPTGETIATPPATDATSPPPAATAVVTPTTAPSDAAHDYIVYKYDRTLWLYDIPTDQRVALAQDIDFGDGYFSPNGEWLSYYFEKDDVESLWLHNVSNERRVPLAEEADEVLFRFAPRGDWLSFAAARDNVSSLYIANVDGSNVELVHQAPTADRGTIGLSAQRISPDGNAFTIYQTMTDQGRWYVYNRSTQRLFELPGYGRAWSFDSRYVFGETDDTYWLFDIQTGNQKQIVTSKECYDFRTTAEWFPDKRHILLQICDNAETREAGTYIYDVVDDQLALIKSRPFDYWRDYDKGLAHFDETQVYVMPDGQHLLWQERQGHLDLDYSDDSMQLDSIRAYITDLTGHMVTELSLPTDMFIYTTHTDETLQFFHVCWDEDNCRSSGWCCQNNCPPEWYPGDHLILRMRNGDYTKQTTFALDTSDFNLRLVAEDSWGLLLPQEKYMLLTTDIRTIGEDTTWSNTVLKSLDGQEQQIILNSDMWIDRNHTTAISSDETHFIVDLYDTGFLVFDTRDHPENVVLVKDARSSFFSSRGGWITFFRDRSDGPTDQYVIRVDGTDERLLAQNVFGH